MTHENLTLWIQAAAVVAAVTAAIISLWIAAVDRKNAQRIAEDDRQEALRQSKLQFDMGVLLRLLENQTRGGSTDLLERDKMGAEARALIGYLGPDLVPNLWASRISLTEDQIRQLMSPESDSPEWQKDTFEVYLALMALKRDYESLRPKQSD